MVDIFFLIFVDHSRILFLFVQQLAKPHIGIYIYINIFSTFLFSHVNLLKNTLGNYYFTPDS